jgi:hypothetical protein
MAKTEIECGPTQRLISYDVAGQYEQAISAAEHELSATAEMRR